MADTETVEKPEVKKTEEAPEIKEEEVIVEKPKKEKIEIKGKDILINGEVYDPERAMELIRKQRRFEKDATKLQKKIEEYEQKEKELKEADLSEKDKAILRAEKAEQELAKLTLKEQRRIAAKSVDLPDEFVDRIKGDTPEEMETDAQRMKAALPTQKSNIGVTNPGQNATPQTETKEQTLRRMGLIRQ